MSRPPRPPLHQRLDSLLVAPGDKKPEGDTMRPPRIPSRRTSPMPTRPTLDNLVNSVQEQLSGVPVLRWFGASPSNTPHTSPTTPTLEVLDEALHAEIDRHPKKRTPHPPNSFRASRALSRPPAFFDNLTRSTLPTASISTFTLSPLLNGRDLVGEQSPPVPILMSARRTSSIDTLRTVQSRSFHSSPPKELASSPPSQAWWPFSGTSKDEVDPLLAPEDQREDAQDEAEHLQTKYLAPGNPVVFCHGLLGFDSVSIGPGIASVQVTHWRGIREALEKAGCEVLITRVPATSSPIERAKVLADTISDKFPGRKVHLIGHSMGGLDCRYLATHITQRTFSVLSVTTIATPHRGSAFADHFLNTVGRERLPSVLTLLDMLPNGGGDGTAFEFLTLENMRLFNEHTPDAPGVRYFSWGAWYQPGLIDTWRWPHGVVLEKEGPNDGLVSVESAKWGTYLGTLENVSHLDLVGWTNAARYRWAEIMGREIRFKPATFYLSIADHLARAVEGQGAEDNGDGTETPRTHERHERERLAEHIEGKAGAYVVKPGEHQNSYAFKHTSAGETATGVSQSRQVEGQAQATRPRPRPKDSGDTIPGEPEDDASLTSGAALHRDSVDMRRRSLRREVINLGSP